MTLLAVGALGGRAQENGAAVARNDPPARLPQDEGPFRPLAPGVERVINPESLTEELIGRHDVTQLWNLGPNFGVRPWSSNLSNSVRFPLAPTDWQLNTPLPQLDIWSLEMTIKPLRFIEVDLPNEAGRFDRKNIWYLVYHLRNLSDEPVRFIPRVVLYSWDNKKYYPDRLIPLAIRPIELREDPNRTLLDSVAISDVEILPSEAGQDNSVWGVFTWHDIDPQTDRFSIYIQGLTNAYRWGESPAGERKYFRKTLVLNYWRPGDDQYEHEREIRLGIPGDVDYRWVYK